MPQFLSRLAFAFSAAAGVACLFLHFGTFLTAIPPIWLLVPFALAVGAVLCTKISGFERRVVVASPGWRWRSVLSLVLLVYAVLTFMYFYRTTGGASSVGVVGGHYVAMSKSGVIKIITEREYYWYPNPWTRV